MYNLIEYSSNNFKFFMYKGNSLKNTESDGANGILRNTTLAVLLKYLSNF